MTTRRALVTGAAGGLAAGIAPALARGGFAHVAVTYRDTPAAAVCAAIESAGAVASADRIDFLRPAGELVETLDAIIRARGPFDTLVHAVGPLVVKRFERLTEDDYHESFDGNVRSAVVAARAVLPAMREGGFGRIVFFGALGAEQTRPFRGLAFYQAAKSALIAFARCLALEEAHRGITINVVVPGDVRDKVATRAETLERRARNPRGRPASFEDIADAVCFLIAAERDFVNGAVLEVTGGATEADERNEPPS